jgi:hypothetical protein
MLAFFNLGPLEFLLLLLFSLAAVGAVVVIVWRSIRGGRGDDREP